MMVIASHATPAGETSSLRTLEAERVLAQVSDELATALSVTEMEANSVAFTVSDRDGDGLGETIRYSWGGTSGDPLTRELNGGAPVTVASGLTEFDIDYETDETETAPSTPAVEEGPEELMIQQDALNTGFQQSTNINGGTVAGELIQPTLPADATGFRITRVLFQADASGSADGVFAVQIRQRQISGAPSGAVLDQVLVNEADLVPGNWYEVDFTEGGPLDPTLGGFVIFKQVSGNGVVASLKVGNFSPMTPNTTYFSSSNSELTWIGDNLKNTWLFVYGVPQEESGGGGGGDPEYRLAGAHLQMRTADSLLTAASAMWNTPEVDGP